MNRGRKIISALAGIMIGGVFVVSSASYLLVSQANSTVQHLLTQVNEQFPGEISLGELKFEGTTLALYNVTLKDAQGEPLVEIPKATANIDLGNFLEQRHWLALPGSIHIDNPNVYATIDELGQFNFASIAVESDKPTEMPPLRYLGADLHLHNGRIVFKDKRNGGFMYQLENVQLNAQAHPLQATDVALTLNPSQDQRGSLTLAGKIFLERPEFSARLDLENWELKRAADYPLVRRHACCYDGRLDADLWAECNAQEWSDILDHLAYGGTAKIGNGIVSVPQLDMPIRQIRATAKIANGLVTVQDGFANLGGVGAILNGNVYLPPRPRLDLNLNIPRLRTDVIKKLLHRDLPVSGSAAISVQAQGTYQQPSFTGEIAVDKLTVQGQDLQKCHIDWEFQDKLLTIAELKGQAVGGEFTGQGYVYLDPQDPYVLFSMKGQDANLGSLSPVGGKIEKFDVNLLGSLKDPLVYGGSSGISGFTGAAAPLYSASGRFLYTNDSVIISQGEANTSYGQVNLPYAYYGIKDSEVMAAVDTSGFSIPQLHINGFGDISGRVGGTFQVDGSLKDLRTLALCGYSRNTTVNINNVELSDFNGGIGFQNMSLFFPCLSGRGGGGQLSASGWVNFANSGNQVAYSGDGNVAVLGEGVRLDQLASIVRLELPLNLDDPADIGAIWYAEGNSRGNWAQAYAHTIAGLAEPYALAAKAEIVNNELGALAWTDNLRLNSIKVTPELTLASGVTAQLAAGGPLNDLGLAYCANITDLPLTGLRDNTIQGIGSARFHAGQLDLYDNMISWKYERKRHQLRRPHRMQNVTGHANGWLGPELAGSLHTRTHNIAAPPENGMLIVGGQFDINKKSYDASFNALGVDMRWLTRQAALPQLNDIAEKVNLIAGFASAQGRLKGDTKHLQIMPGTNFDVPFMLTKRIADFDSFSGVGSIWTEPSQTAMLGKIHIDPVVLSRRAYDPQLPYGSQLKDYDWLNKVRQGWLYIDGSIDGPEISLDMAVDGWDLDSAMAFAPASVNIDENLCTGLWYTDDLAIRLNTSKPIVETLELSGTLAMNNGAINVKDWSIPVKEFSSTIVQRGRELNLEKMFFDTGIQKLYGKGQRHLDGSWIADVWARDIPLEYISSFDDALKRLSGKADLALHLTSPNSNFSEPTLYLGLEGHKVSIYPDLNRSAMFTSANNDNKADKSLSQKVFDKQEKSQTPTAEENDKKEEEDVKQFLQNFMSLLSKPVKFSEFRLGRIAENEDGELFTDASLGLELKRDSQYFTLNVPDDVLCLEAYAESTDFDKIWSKVKEQVEKEEKEAKDGQHRNDDDDDDNELLTADIPDPEQRTRLTASGRIDFGLDFSGGAQKWFMGPTGPDFGTSDRPFTVGLHNFNNDIMRALLGKLPQNNFFTTSGELSLKGQWYRDSSLNKPNDSLNYLLDITQLNFGHYKENSADNDWIGLELDNNLQFHYKRENNLGKLVVPPFHIRPHAISLREEQPNNANKEKGAKKDKRDNILDALQTDNDGEVTGEADIVLAKGSSDMAQEQQSYARLKVSNMPVIGLTSFVTDAPNLGFIDSIDFEANGPVTAPDFDLSFHVSDGNFSKVSYSSIEGAAFGRCQDDNYVIDLGQNIDDALRIYLGKQKYQDWNVNLWGQIPLKVHRSELAYNGGLVPVWEGVTYEENGEIDLTANLTDKQLYSASTFVPDVTSAKGTLKSDIRITGSPTSPNVSGYLTLDKGEINHAKAGTITNINVSANFDKVIADQLRAEFQEFMKQISRRPGFVKRKRTQNQEEMPMPSINRLTLDKCEATIGEQKIVAGGYADFLGFTPLMAKIDINGHDLPLRWGSLFEGIVDVNAQVEAAQRTRPGSSESQMTMVLSGDINVKTGEVGVSMNSSDSSPVDWKAIPLYYQLLLNMSDEVWVNAFNSRVRTSGTLYIMPNEETNAPQLAGSVDISRGTLAVPFYDVRFKLRSGQVTFESSNNPVLEDVMAESEVSGYQISTFVDGTYPNINLRFSSYPQLAENEIKQLLALGTVSSSSTMNNMNNQVPTVGAQQYTSTNWSGNNQGTAMLSRMLASPITSSISKLLFLSDFSVDVGSDKSYSMKVAKALDKNEKVMLILTTSFDPRYNYTTNLFGVEWRAKHNLMVRLAADERGHFLPWFQGRWDF